MKRLGKTKSNFALKKSNHYLLALKRIKSGPVILQEIATGQQLTTDSMSDLTGQ